MLFFNELCSSFYNVSFGAALFSRLVCCIGIFVVAAVEGATEYKYNTIFSNTKKTENPMRLYNNNLRHDVLFVENACCCSQYKMMRTASTHDHHNRQTAR